MFCSDREREKEMEKNGSRSKAFSFEKESWGNLVSIRRGINDGGGAQGAGT